MLLGIEIIYSSGERKMRKMLALSVLSIFAVSLMAIQSGQVTGRDKHLIKLMSPEFSVRAEAVNAIYKLNASERDSELISRLIDVYRMELGRDQKRLGYAELPGKFEDKVPAELQYTNTQEFAHYYLKMSEIIAETKRLDLLPTLVEHALTTPVLIHYGDLAIDPVISVLEKEKDVSRKQSALQVLQSIYAFSGSSYRPSDTVKKRIFTSLMKTAEEDCDGPIRANAVRFIGKNGDVSVIPFLEKIAANDAFEVDKETEAGTIEKVHPVRITATKALNEVKNRQKR
jgi:hypothetical protein